ncbi:MAG TPA: hypothetical protein DF383_04595 [Deltaproteobacteria bacterium]|nr:hypothetical protein [Deltaproteobacteria bacterium]
MAERSLYIDFEDERLREITLDDLDVLKSAFFELNPHLVGKECFFFLDEIQNVSGWEKFARRLIERSPIQVVVTGSSSRMMPSEIHTALRGRAWSRELLPLSFREFLQIKGYAVADPAFGYGEQKALVKRECLDFIQWGGFPEVALLGSKEEKSKVLKDYLEAMFFRDLAERYRVTNIPLLDALLDTLFSSAAQKFSLTSFYKKNKADFPFSKDSLFDYYKYFLRSLLVYEVRLFSPSAYKRTRNPAKIYLVDTGLAKRVTSEDSGRLLENAVFLELRRRGFELAYDGDEGECDFVAKSPEGKLSCYQVTRELQGNQREREIQGLLKVCQKLKLREGWIISSEEEEDFSVAGIDIHVVPFWRWAVSALSTTFSSGSR